MQIDLGSWNRPFGLLKNLFSGAGFLVKAISDDLWLSQWEIRDYIGAFEYNILHLERKYVPTFVNERCLFPEANSFEKNCELRVTDNVLGQISELILNSNGGYCVHYSSNIYLNTKIGE